MCHTADGTEPYFTNVCQLLAAVLIVWNTDNK